MNLTLCEFCEGFFHVEQSVEMNVPNICLCTTLCSRKSVTCIARITNDSTGEELYISAYKNARQYRTFTTHAEKIMMSDINCLRAVCASHDPRTMDLYLTYQPCHFSGGHHRPLPISCTDELIQYNRNQLQKHNVKLNIKVAYIYRAFWDTDKSESKYWRMIENAKSGICLLRENCIQLTAFSEEDWDFVKKCCSKDAQRQIKNVGELQMEYRKICDAFNRTFLASL